MLLFKQKLGYTWSRTHINFKTKEVYQWYWQLSKKDPWWFPQKKEHPFSGVYYPLYGWLFFSIGRTTMGVLYETEEQTKIQDKQGQYYFICSIQQEADKKAVRASIKKHQSILVQRKPDKTDPNKTILQIIIEE